MRGSPEPLFCATTMVTDAPQQAPATHRVTSGKPFKIKHRIKATNTQKQSEIDSCRSCLYVHFNPNNECATYKCILVILIQRSVTLLLNLS